MKRYERAGVSPKTPVPHCKPMERKKGKTVEDKKVRESYVNKKAMALLLKQTSPTPSNIGSAISFH